MTTVTKTLVDSTKGLKFTESPRWHDGKLWFIDIHDQRIKTVDLSGSVATELEVPFIPNAFGLAPDGTVVVGDAFQRRIYRKTGGALRQVADVSNLTKFCLSDGIVDANGRLYVGDIGYNFNDPAARPVATCVIVLVGPDGRASVVADKLFFPNGLVITPDGRTLIVGETLGHRLTAFAIQKDGSLANRRDWARLPASVRPDGICLDAEGGIWCANPEGEDGVVRVREGGDITHRFRVDTHAYAVMLGGPERKHLFVCASGSHDPAEIHQKPTATIQVVEVEVPGAGIP
jgi:sugar lactone lactonase YvrE